MESVILGAVSLIMVNILSTIPLPVVYIAVGVFCLLISIGLIVYTSVQRGVHDGFAEYQAKNGTQPTVLYIREKEEDVNEETTNEETTKEEEGSTDEEASEFIQLEKEEKD